MPRRRVLILGLATLAAIWSVTVAALVVLNQRRIDADRFLARWADTTPADTDVDTLVHWYHQLTPDERARLDIQAAVEAAVAPLPTDQQRAFAIGALPVGVEPMLAKLDEMSEDDRAAFLHQVFPLHGTLEQQAADHTPLSPVAMGRQRVFDRIASEGFGWLLHEQDPMLLVRALPTLHGFQRDLRTMRHDFKNNDSLLHD